VYVLMEGWSPAPSGHLIMLLREGMLSLLVLHSFCTRLILSPAGVSFGCWISSPPLSRVAESLFWDTSLLVQIVS
jgi:hypothetical protein